MDRGATTNGLGRAHIERKETHRLTDKLNPAARSDNMRAIKSKNMLPEISVRRIAYGLGYRFRLHVKDLPGKPDLVFRPRKKVIFVHGCFWHQHAKAKCLDGRLPNSNSAYWTKKLLGNVERDRRHVKALRQDGWRVLVIWECETKDEARLAKRLCAFLN
jgi:DNA mismatch endonuclease (patch repair protein)